jgi:DUF971 family protein
MTDQPTRRRSIEIKLHAKSRVLGIAVDDGAAFELPCEYLRVFSRAAEVRTLDQPPTGKDGVDISAIEPQGQYAARIVFDDDHEAGSIPGTRSIDSASNTRITGRMISPGRSSSVTAAKSRGLERSACTFSTLLGLPEHAQGVGGVARARERHRRLLAARLAWRPLTRCRRAVPARSRPSDGQQTGHGTSNQASRGRRHRHRADFPHRIADT